MKKFIDDVKTKKIPYGKFGYSTIATDDLIDQIVENFEIVLAENEKLKDIEQKYLKIKEKNEKLEAQISYYRSINNKKEVFDFETNDEEE